MSGTLPRRPDPKNKLYLWCSGLAVPSLTHFNEVASSKSKLTPEQFRIGLEVYRSSLLVIQEEGLSESGDVTYQAQWSSPPTLSGLKAHLGFGHWQQLHRFLDRYPQCREMYEWFKGEVEAFSEGCLFTLTNSSGAQFWLRNNTETYAKDKMLGDDGQQEPVNAKFVLVDPSEDIMQKVDDIANQKRDEPMKDITPKEEE